MVVSQRQRLEQKIAILLQQLKAFEVRGRGHAAIRDPAAEGIFRRLTEARRELHDLRPE